MFNFWGRDHLSSHVMSLSQSDYWLLISKSHLRADWLLVIWGKFCTFEAELASFTQKWPQVCTESASNVHSLLGLILTHSRSLIPTALCQPLLTSLQQPLLTVLICPHLMSNSIVLIWPLFMSNCIWELIIGYWSVQDSEAEKAVHIWGWFCAHLRPILCKRGQFGLKCICLNWPLWH